VAGLCWSRPGPCPGRVFSGWCSWVEHRLVGRRVVRRALVRSRLFGVVVGNASGVSGGGLGTLLGPEGAGVGVCSFWAAGAPGWGCWWLRVILSVYWSSSWGPAPGVGWCRP